MQYSFCIEVSSILVITKCVKYWAVLTLKLVEKPLCDILKDIQSYSDDSITFEQLCSLSFHGDAYKFQARFKKFNGEIFQAETTLKRIKYQDNDIFLLVINSVSEKNSLNPESKIFEALFKQSDQFIAIISTDGKVVKANKKAVDAIGKEEEKVVGEYFWNTPWWTSDNNEVQKLKSAFEAASSGIAHTMETVHIDKDGISINIAFSLTPIFSSEGKIELLLAEGKDITYIKNTETELRRNRQLLSAAIENSLSGMVIVSKDGKDRIVNNSAYELRTGVVSITNFEDKPQTVPYWETYRLDMSIYNRHDLPLQRSLYKGEIVRNEEAYVKNSHGEFRTIIINSNPIYDSEGNISAAVGVFTDLTDIKKIEDKLTESEQNYRLLLDYTYNVEYFRNAKGKITYISPSVETLIGYTSEEILSGVIDLRDLVHPDDINFFNYGENSPENRIENSIEQECRLAKSNGDYVWVNLYSVPVYHNEEFIGFRLSLTNINDKKLAEIKLVESERRWQYALEGANQGIWDWNLITNEVFYSKIWKEMLGYQEDEIENSTDIFKSLMHPDDLPRVLSAVSSYLDGETDEFYVEHRLLCKNGEYKWILASGKIMNYDEDGKPMHFMGAHTDISYIKSIESELVMQEERMRLVLEATSDIVWDLDLKENQAYFNDKWYSMFGLQPGMEIDVMDTFERMIHTDDLPQFHNVIDNAVNNNTGYEIEFRMKKIDGEIIWIHAKGKVTVVDAEGTATRISGTYSDITQRKIAELAVLQVKDNQTILINSAPFGVATLNNSGEIIFLNDKFSKLFGWDIYNIHEMFEQIDLVYPDPEISETKRKTWLQDINNSVGNGIEIPVRTEKILTKNREIRDANITLVTFQDVAYAFFEDITERLVYQREITNLAENLKTTLKSIGDGVIATDIKGNIVLMNPIAEKLTGWDNDSAVGLNINEVFVIKNETSKEVLASPIDKVLSGGEIVTLEENTILINRHGLIRNIADSAAPIKDSTGNITGVVLVFRDVTDALRLEEEFRQAQKMDLIGQLAGGVAHDFNNMLAGIMGFSEIISMNNAEDSKNFEYAKRIYSTAERAAELTKKLLAFSRKGKIMSTPIDVHESISSAIAILERSIDKKITIDVELQAKNSIVVGDPALLQSAILNLAVNARDAMPNGGILRFISENVELDESFLKMNAFNLETGNYLMVEISDTGMGIPKDNLNKNIRTILYNKRSRERYGAWFVCRLWCCARP